MPSSTGGLSATLTLTPGALLIIPFPVDSSMLDSVILSNYSPYLCRVSCGEHQGFLSPWTVDKFQVGHGANIQVMPDATTAGAAKPVPVISSQIIAAFVRSEEYELHSNTYTYPAPLITPDQTAQAIYAQGQAGAVALPTPNTTTVLFPNPAGNRLNNGSAIVYDCQGMQGYSVTICDGYYTVATHNYGWYLFDWFADDGLLLSVGHDSWQVNIGVASTIEGPVRGRYLRIYAYITGDALVSLALSTFPKVKRATDNSVTPGGSATASIEHASCDGRFGLLLRIASTSIAGNNVSPTYRVPLASNVITIVACSTAGNDNNWRVVYGFGTDANVYSFVRMSSANGGLTIPAPSAPMWIIFQNYNAGADSFVALITTNA